jgi:hypothetical protein
MPDRSGKCRIVVSGYVGLLQAGGVTWDYLQYPLGLAALGHDVYYVEDTRLWPIYQRPTGDVPDCTSNVAHLAAAMRAFGLGERWSYRDEPSGAWYGLSEARVAEVLRTADVMLNVSCSTPLRDAYMEIPVRVLIDSDPMFTQIQAQNDEGFTPGAGVMRAAVQAHTHHFTFGEAIGQPTSRIPTGDVHWRPTRQPVCLDRWMPSPMPDGDRAAFTTVMNWSAARALRWQGEDWGQKNIEFESVFGLPSRFRTRPLALAIGQTGGSAVPLARLQVAGWRLLNPKACAGTPAAYQQFITDSFGEFSVAKEAYVKGRTGWFSCRSACYLASGRPVVTQDTGWSSIIAPGEGLLSFTDLDSAVGALDRVLTDPSRHGASARAVAEEYFDSRVVLGRLLEASAG